MVKRFFLVMVFVASQGISFHAATPVHYTLTFPAPPHRWLQVEASFTDLAAVPLELRLRRSSPGRDARHEGAKNGDDGHAAARDGRERQATRPEPDGGKGSGGQGGSCTGK